MQCISAVGGRALVTLRSFLGVVYLSNGAAKLFEFSGFSIGPWRQFLIDRNGARRILSSGPTRRQMGPRRRPRSWVTSESKRSASFGVLTRSSLMVTDSRPLSRKNRNPEGVHYSLLATAPDAN